MARSARFQIPGLATCLFAALVVAGCSSGTPKARLDGSSDLKSDARDAADTRDLRTDGTDSASGETASEVPAPNPDASDGPRDGTDADSDGADSGTGGAAGTAGTAGTGAGGAGTGGMGSGGAGTGGTGSGGTGTGTGGNGIGGMGTGGTGTGGVGTGGTGTGGVGTGGSGTGGNGSGGAGGDADAGSDAPADAGDDTPASGTGGATGNDAAGDLATDDAEGCGPGCPPNVRPVAIWLAADYGVQCDLSSTRVTNWMNRGYNGGTIAPITGHSGPLCPDAARQLGGRPVLSFDTPGTNDDDGVLTLDLAPLTNQTGYTVFVVERRQSNNEGYFLGSTLALNAIACDLLAHSAYRFGYEPPMLWSGPYVADDNNDCFPPTMNPAAFSASNPQAALDIEVFDPAVGHVMSSDGVELYRDADLLPIDFNPTTIGFIGKAFQALDLNTRHSRFRGDIAEIVIYAAVLTPSEIQSVATYLSNRWGGLAH